MDGRDCKAGVSFSGRGGPCSFKVEVEEGRGEMGVSGGSFELVGAAEGVGGTEFCCCCR